MSDSAPQAILMAAGKGTRMQSDLPKVLHEVAGRPMLHWVVEACEKAGANRCVVIVGYKAELVIESLKNYTGQIQIEFAEQTEQLGTGHAVMMAKPSFEDQVPCDVFVLAGDGPLIRETTLATLLQTHRESGAGATMATSVIDDPSGYGRVVRDSIGNFAAIVEQKDASPEQLAIQEVNPSYYCFASADLFGSLDKLTNKNASGEYYITDVPAILKQEGKAVSVVDAVPSEDILSINTLEQLADVDAVLKARLAAAI